MEELIDRLEKTAEPDPALDLEIARFFGTVHPVCGGANPDGSKWAKGEQTWRRYTSSIDDALSLVPKNHYWSVSRGMDDAGMPVGCEQSFSAVCPEEPFSFSDDRIWHKHPAIAVCIAALRARAVTTEQR